MSNLKLAILIVVSGLVGIALCSAAAAERPRLKDAFKDDFVVGAAIGEDQIMGEEPQSMELVAEQFNAISPENCLKWAEVHPEPDRYDFEQADKYVEFGEQHGMFILGHTLVWHNQTPAWVFKDAEGKPISRQALLERMREHIHTVVGRYKGRIDGWDVVNEAVMPDGTMRPTKWLEIIGPDYLAKAYEFAHEADPDAELYYNDYNEWYPEMRKTVVKLVRDLKAGGARIDAIGMQGHWRLDEPALDEAEASLVAFADAAGKVNITELDIATLPDGRPYRGMDISKDKELMIRLDPYPEGLPDQMQEKLAARYRDVFTLLVKHADKIDRVTFWGVHDGQTWLSYHPVRGRHAYPLLFDAKLRPKPAFDAVIEVAK